MTLFIAPELIAFILYTVIVVLVPKLCVLALLFVFYLTLGVPYNAYWLTILNILSTKLVYNILQSHYKYNCFNTINPYFVLFIYFVDSIYINDFNNVNCNELFDIGNDSSIVTISVNNIFVVWRFGKVLFIIYLFYYY